MSTIYAVRNRDGQWLRRIGYGGAGRAWVDDFASATLYRKLAQARSRVTFFAKTYPDYGVPVIVEFTMTETGLLDESVAVRAKVAAIHKRNEEYRRKVEAWTRADPRR